MNTRQQLFTSPVRLAFDPMALSVDEPIYQVFADKVARTIWLSWRPSHIVSNEFHAEVLALAALIKVTAPTSAEDLERLMKRHIWQRWNSAFRCPSTPAWCKQVFPFLTGTELLWEVQAERARA